jgi:hypothetical protein
MRDSYRLRSNIGTLVAGGLGAILFVLTASSTIAKEMKTETRISAPSVPVGPSDLTRPSVAKTNQSSYKRYFVEFRARSAASYGHMYVIYGQVNNRGEIVTSDIAGLHPAGDTNDCLNCSVVAWTIGHVIPVPAEIGASDGDLEEKYVTARYRVWVDTPTFNKISVYIHTLKADKTAHVWNALWRSCVLFGDDIATHVGLKTPGLSLMEPKEYVETLRDLNGGKPQEPLKFAAPTAASTGLNTSGAMPSAPSKRKKQPVANLSPSQTVVGVASGNSR